MSKDLETKRLDHRRSFLMAKMRVSRWVASRRLMMGFLIYFVYFVTFHGWGSSILEFDPVGITFGSAAINQLQSGGAAGRTVDRSSALLHNDQHSRPIGGAGSTYSRMKRLLKTLQEELDQPVPFLLVTGESGSPCKSEQGSHLLMKSFKNKVDYCNLHGCKVWYALESWKAGFTGSWAKYPVLLHLMRSNPNIEWFMWMDSDALFTDLAVTIPFELYNEWNKNLIVAGNWEKVYAKDPDWHSLNVGSFLVRNCEWSHRFLEKWADFGSPENKKELTAKLNAEFNRRPKDWPADDQTALAYLLRQNRTEHEQNAFIETSYTSLYGFWEQDVDRYVSRGSEGRGEGGERTSWPFITQFRGCNLCSVEFPTWKAVVCVENFERAYHFGDNQALALAGLRHLHLSTYTVVPTGAADHIE